MGIVIALNPKRPICVEPSNPKRYNSQNLKLSRVPKRSMDISTNLKFHDDMIDRDAIVRRLNLLPSVLGKRHGEIAELIGCTPGDWSNWRSPTGTVAIQAEAALELYRVFDISMDWVYGGELSQIRNQTLRERIVMAEHERTQKIAKEAAETLDKGAKALQKGAKKLDKAATKLDKAIPRKRRAPAA